MILQTLEIENFGIYSGVHRFELAPHPDARRPIILVTGHNGGGKSTFFEAVRLALYGKRCLGIRIAQSQYDSYLLEKIHVQSAKKSARIRLAFIRVEEGQQRHYEVVRAWAARGTSVTKSFDLTCDGTEVPDLSPGDQQHYVEDLVPPSISQLFFFDGEKIQDLANTESYSAIRDSVRMLFGLDLIEQLRTDLALYAARIDKSDADVHFDALQVERARVDDAIQIAEEKRADTNSRRDQVLGRIRRAERQFRNEGGRSATDREQLQRTLRENVLERERLLHLLKSLAGSLLPLSLSPSLTQQLKRTVDEAQRQSGSAAITSFIAACEEYVRTSESSTNLWSSEHFETLRRLARENCSNAPFALDADPAFISDRLTTLTDTRRAEASELAVKIDQNTKQRGLLEQQLQAFDVGQAIDALHELKAAERQRGAIEAALNKQDRTIQDLRNRRSTLESELHRTQQDILRQTRGHRSRDIAARTAAALVEYEEQLLDARVENIERHFVSCFNNLIRKRNLVKSIVLDKRTFDIALMGVDGNRVPHDSLSAGERQLFAVSMLWALAKTSGQSLPILIDMPLSRLDYRHRNAFLESYVAEASHQVILLCTDTEITPDLEQKIKPYISTAYHLTVADGSHSTKSVPTYAYRQTDLVHAHK